MVRVSNRIFLNRCPDDCNDENDIFKQLNFINIKNQSQSQQYKGFISIIVPGNAGKPGGGHGTSVYDDNNSIILKDMNINKKPLEEQIIRACFGELYKNDKENANKIFRENIGNKWGLLYKKSVRTKQKINYTSKYLLAETKYNLAYKVMDIKLYNTHVDLLFTFAPNFNNGIVDGIIKYPTLYYTCEPPENNNLKYKIKALKTSIIKCLLIADSGYILIPYLGGGVNKCFLISDKYLKNFIYLKNKIDNYNFNYLTDIEKKSYIDLTKIAKNNYYNLIKEICYEIAYSYPNKFMSIYVML